MSLAARVGDSESGGCNVGAKCCPHSRSGTIATASNDVYIEGIRAARLNDIGSCNCPHSGTFRISSASNSVFINYRGSARLGDSTTCMGCGVGGAIVSASNSVFIGN